MKLTLRITIIAAVVENLEKIILNFVILLLIQNYIIVVVPIC